MKIKGNVHCFFEQSGTFKNEFKKLGYNAYDYDIQNNFNETDYIIDLFNEINNAYEGKSSIFDNITPDDLIFAFYPCIYFTSWVNPVYFCGTSSNLQNMDTTTKIDYIIDRAYKRNEFYVTLLKFCKIIYAKNLRLIFENPYTTEHYLYNNFIEQPAVIDKNRRLRGDYFKKPTGYWFINCKNTYGQSYQLPKEFKRIKETHDHKKVKAGICSKERSMISSDYARNFICDFIIGKTQNISQGRLF